jgi:general secretion pathway protein E
MTMHTTPDLEAISDALRIAAITLGEMRAAASDFDAIPFAEATRRGCAALRAPDGMLLVVLGDAYDLDTQDWIEERLREPFGYRVARREELAAYLSQQETQLRALDGIAKELSGEPGAGAAAQEISFESAAEADSTVVRLVTSTLYDALKAGASDVHL